MKNKEYIVAISVTYNDSDFLCRCAAALKEQTYSIDRIIIVDNCSAQEHKDRIKQLQDERTEILWLEENKGGAGGFEAGMAYALKKYDPDWYWIMDGDAHPQKNCLENLLKYKNEYENIGCLTPLIYGDELQKYQLYHHKKESLFLDRDIKLYKSYEEIPEISFIQANAFVGPMFSKEAVRSCGVPDGELFIYGDDREYTYRISQKYRILLIKSAVINHRDQADGNNRFIDPRKWWKDYYMYRNMFLFIKKYQKSHWKYCIATFLVMLRVFLFIGFAILQKEYRGLRKIRIRLLIKAIQDGLNGKTGKTVDPLEFRGLSIPK